MKLRTIYRGRPLTRRTFRVYLVCGQSNVVGTTNLDGGPTNDTAHDDAIEIWDSSGTDGSLAYVSGGWRTFRSWSGGYGPERGLARTLATNGVDDVAIIKWARNGESITRWLKSANDFYPQLVADVLTAFGALSARGTATFGGMLWFHGYGDTAVESQAIAYEVNLTQLLSDLRADTELADAPVVIGRGPAWWTTEYKDVVREAQVQVAANELGWVNSDDTPPRADYVHLTAKGKEMVGERAASLFLAAQ